MKANLGDANVTARWDKTTGSVDTIMDFASQPSALDPEAAARDFLQANAGLFGISDMAGLRLKRNTEALGGSFICLGQQRDGGDGDGRRRRDEQHPDREQQHLVRGWQDRV